MAGSRHCCAPPATPTSRCTSSRSRPSSPPSDCAASAPGSSRPAGSNASAACCPTRSSPRPPRTPRSWPPGSLAVRAASSEAASTCRCVPAAAKSWTSARAAAVALLLAAPAHRAGQLPPLRGLARRCRSRSTGCGCAERSTPVRSPPRSRSPPPTCPPRTASSTDSPERRPILLDRFARENYNSVLLARSGGKSYLAKLEALRLLYRGVQVFVIDPEDEYRRLCEAVGGVYLPLAGEETVALNPLDLALGRSAARARGTRALPRRADRAPARRPHRRGAGRARPRRPRLLAAAGISDEPATQGRAALLSDLARVLDRRGRRAEPGRAATAVRAGSHLSLRARPRHGQRGSSFASARGRPSASRRPCSCSASTRSGARSKGRSDSAACSSTRPGS